MLPRMFERTVSIDELARLKAAREEADRRYNDALTALDQAMPPASAWPDAPPPPDEHQVTPLNEQWPVVGAGPEFGTGWRARIRRFLWAFVGPMLERQQVFNALIVDHVNRRTPGDRATREALAGLLEGLRAQSAALAAFESRLLVFLQQITPYLDTKDYEFAGLSRRVHEDDRELIDVLDHRTVGLGGAISGVGDELAKRWESMVARERRFEASVAALATGHEDLRTTLAAARQMSLTVKRELERWMAAAPATPGAPGAAGPPAPAPLAPERASATAAIVPPAPPPVEAFKYVGFEDRFRGSPDDIRSRLADYLPLFDGASDVVDLGCGRGEFLDLLRERGISGRGLDSNHEMVEICRARGLIVDEGDALAFLEGVDDGALGGLIATQVVEHLAPDYLLALIQTAYYKLRPGSRLVLETINPTCWVAFFESYIRDITHVRPLHPDTLSYYVGVSGFQRVSVQFRSPVPDHQKLTLLPDGDPRHELLNVNLDRLNSLIFGYMDYAVVAERG
jgi:SAM-dependent methyltransferase